MESFVSCRMSNSLHDTTTVDSNSSASAVNGNVESSEPNSAKNVKIENTVENVITNAQGIENHHQPSQHVVQNQNLGAHLQRTASAEQVENDDEDDVIDFDSTSFAFLPDSPKSKKSPNQLQKTFQMGHDEGNHALPSAPSVSPTSAIPIVPPVVPFSSSEDSSKKPQISNLPSYHQISAPTLSLTSDIPKGTERPNGTNTPNGTSPLLPSDTSTNNNNMHNMSNSDHGNNNKSIHSGDGPLPVNIKPFATLSQQALYQQHIQLSAGGEMLNHGMTQTPTPPPRALSADPPTPSSRGSEPPQLSGCGEPSGGTNTLALSSAGESEIDDSDIESSGHNHGNTTGLLDRALSGESIKTPPPSGSMINTGGMPNNNNNTNPSPLSTCSSVSPFPSPLSRNLSRNTATGSRGGGHAENEIKSSGNYSGNEVTTAKVSIQRYNTNLTGNRNIGNHTNLTGNRNIGNHTHMTDIGKTKTKGKESNKKEQQRRGPMSLMNPKPSRRATRISVQELVKGDASVGGGEIAIRNHHQGEAPLKDNVVVGKDDKERNERMMQKLSSNSTTRNARKNTTKKKLITGEENEVQGTNVKSTWSLMDSTQLQEQTLALLEETNALLSNSETRSEENRYHKSNTTMSRSGPGTSIDITTKGSTTTTVNGTLSADSTTSIGTTAGNRDNNSGNSVERKFEKDDNDNCIGRVLNRAAVINSENQLRNSITIKTNNTKQNRGVLPKQRKPKLHLSPRRRFSRSLLVDDVSQLKLLNEPLSESIMCLRESKAAAFSESLESSQFLRNDNETKRVKQKTRTVPKEHLLANVVGNGNMIRRSTSASVHHRSKSPNGPSGYTGSNTHQSHQMQHQKPSSSMYHSMQLPQRSSMHHSIQAGMSLILDGRSCILPHDISMSFISARSDFCVYSRNDNGVLQSQSDQQTTSNSSDRNNTMKDNSQGRQRKASSIGSWALGLVGLGGSEDGIDESHGSAQDGRKRTSSSSGPAANGQVVNNNHGSSFGARNVYQRVFSAGGGGGVVGGNSTMNRVRSRSESSRSNRSSSLSSISSARTNPLDGPCQVLEVKLRPDCSSEHIRHILENVVLPQHGLMVIHRDQRPGKCKLVAEYSSRNDDHMTGTDAKKNIKQNERRRSSGFAGFTESLWGQTRASSSTNASNAADNTKIMGGGTNPSSTTSFSRTVCIGIGVNGSFERVMLIEVYGQGTAAENRSLSWNQQQNGNEGGGDGSNDEGGGGEDAHNPVSSLETSVTGLSLYTRDEFTHRFFLAIRTAIEDERLTVSSLCHPDCQSLSFSSSSSVKMKTNADSRGNTKRGGQESSTRRITTDLLDPYYIEDLEQAFAGVMHSELVAFAQPLESYARNAEWTCAQFIGVMEKTFSKCRLPMPAFERQPSLSSFPLDVDLESCKKECQSQVRELARENSAGSVRGGGGSLMFDSSLSIRMSMNSPSMRSSANRGHFGARVMKRDLAVKELLAERYQIEAQARMRRKNKHVLARVKRVSDYRSGLTRMLRDSELALQSVENQGQFASCFGEMLAGYEVVLASTRCSIGNWVGVLFVTCERIAFWSGMLGVTGKTESILFNQIAAIWKGEGMLMSTIGITLKMEDENPTINNENDTNGEKEEAPLKEEFILAFPAMRDRIFEVMEQVLVMRREEQGMGVY